MKLKINIYDFKIQLLIISIMLFLTLLFNDIYVTHLMILCMIYSAVAMNWNIVAGYTGVIHIAQQPFFVAGGYISGILSVKLGYPSIIGIIAAAVIALLFSLVIGAVSLRVKGIYLLLITLAVRLIMLSFVLYFIEWTNGDTGILLPPIEILGVKINQFNAIPSFIFAYFLMMASLILVKVISDSKLGLAFISLRDSEVYAISRGINPYRTKLTAFVLSSWLTGICGAFYGHYLGTIGPWDLGWSLLVTLLASMVLGGLGTLYGPLLGSFVLVFLNEYFRPLQLFRPTIYGLLLISTLILLPNGLISILAKLKSRFHLNFLTKVNIMRSKIESGT